MDPLQGQISDPPSLHKYLYCYADPVNCIDPSGEFSLGGMLSGLSIRQRLSALSSSVSLQAHRLARATVRGYQAVRGFLFRFWRTASSGRMQQLIEEAKRRYPNLANKPDHGHHPFPEYILRNMAKKPPQWVIDQLNRLTVKIPAAYHQVIHNKIYEKYPKATTIYDNLDKVTEKLLEVYRLYPLPDTVTFPTIPL